METVTVNKTLAPVLAGLIRQHMNELRSGYNVASLALFGSYVRGDQTPESDVDILVEFDAAIGFFKFIDLEERLSNIIGRKVDLVSRGGIKPRIYEHVKDSLLFVRIVTRSCFLRILKLQLSVLNVACKDNRTRIL